MAAISNYIYHSASKKSTNWNMQTFASLKQKLNFFLTTNSDTSQNQKKKF